MTTVTGAGGLNGKLGFISTVETLLRFCFLFYWENPFQSYFVFQVDQLFQVNILYVAFEIKAWCCFTLLLPCLTFTALDCFATLGHELSNSPTVIHISVCLRALFPQQMSCNLPGMFLRFILVCSPNSVVVWLILTLSLAAESLCVDY